MFDAVVFDALFAVALFVVVLAGAPAHWGGRGRDRRPGGGHLAV